MAPSTTRSASRRLRLHHCACLAFPSTYTGTHLGVTATVPRPDATPAPLPLRAGPFPLASGEARLSEDGALALANVAPTDERIVVDARVRYVGDISMCLYRTT